MQRIIRTFIVVTVIMLGVCVPGHAFSDTQGHWAEEIIDRWAQEDIISGFEDGTFRPDEVVTRAQFISILYHLFQYPYAEGFEYQDVKKTDWYYEAVRTMDAYGIIYDGTQGAKPNEPLTRSEVAFALSESLGSVVVREGFSAPPGPFSDLPTGTPHGYDIRVMSYYRLLSGYPDRTFRPNGPITRAEVLAVIDNLTDVYITQPGHYTLRGGENALVLSSDVSIHYTAAGENPSILTVMPPVQGTVSISAAEPVSVSVIHVYQGEEAAIKAGDGVSIHRLSYRNLEDSLADYRFDSGRGHSDRPYMISTPAQFELLREWAGNEANGRKVYFRLANDLTLPGTDWLPIGYGANQNGHQAFYSHLDGGGHTITYRVISADYTRRTAGLFAVLGLGSSVKNLTLAGEIDLTLNRQLPEHSSMLLVGGIAGLNNGELERCHSEMSIRLYNDNPDYFTYTATDSGTATEDASDDSGATRQDGTGRFRVYVGGFAGGEQGTKTTDCTFNGKINVEIGTAKDTTKLCVGGFFGETRTHSTIYTFASNAEITCTAPAVENINLMVGGIAGSMYNARVHESSFEGSIRSTGGYRNYVGGITGHMTFAPGQKPSALYINKCYSIGDITVRDAIDQCEGGLIVGQQTLGTVKNCWAAGTVTVTGNTRYKNQGAISGSCRSTAVITDCWADVSGLTFDADAHVGGITGPLAGSLVNCFVIGVPAQLSGNALSHTSWSNQDLTACLDATAMGSQARTDWFASCGWNFSSIWKTTDHLPVLRKVAEELQLVTATNK